MNTKTELQWTRWTLGRGTDSTCGTWWIMGPATRSAYIREGVKLFKWDSNTDEFVESGRFQTYRDARDHAQAQ